MFLLEGKEATFMASRLDALRQSALEAGEQIGQRATQIAEQERARSFAIFALVAVSGFALGMLTGLLVAPTSGYETRSRLGNRASDMLSNVRQMAKKREEEIAEKAEQIA
jgi:hypothetical protein